MVADLLLLVMMLFLLPLLWLVQAGLKMMSTVLLKMESGGLTLSVMVRCDITSHSCDERQDG